MTAEQINVIADILGLSAESVAALPEDIKSEMDLIAENSVPETSEERLEVYRALEECWRKALISQAIRDISNNSDIMGDILESIDEQSRNDIAELFLSGAEESEVYAVIISADKAQSETEFQRVMGDG